MSKSHRYKNKAKKLQDGKILTVVQPDITVVCDPEKLDDKGCIGAPDLVIEILSPGNKNIELKDKFEIYQEAGIKEYWIVEPEEYILVYTLTKGKYTGSKPFISGEQVSSTVLPGLSMSVSEIFK